MPRTTATQTSVVPPSVHRYWLFEALAAAWRTMRNRHQTVQLLELTDNQLSDIGLSRADVDYALGAPLTRDPTRELTRLRGH